VRRRIRISSLGSAAALALSLVQAFPIVPAGAGAIAIVAAQLVEPQPANADNIWLHACTFYGNDDVGAGVWSHEQSGSAFAFPDQCNQSGVGAFGVSSPGQPFGGRWGQWGVSSPHASGVGRWHAD
jgi:hypothetical protein